jgi:hypothetical protein
MGTVPRQESVPKQKFLGSRHARAPHAHVLWANNPYPKGKFVPHIDLDCMCSFQLAIWYKKRILYGKIAFCVGAI